MNQAFIAFGYFCLEKMKGKKGESRHQSIKNAFTQYGNLLGKFRDTTAHFQLPATALSADVLERLHKIAKSANLALNSYGIEDDRVKAAKEYLNLTQVRDVERGRFASDLERLC